MSMRGWILSSLGFAATVAIILAGCAQPTPSGGGGGGDASAGQTTFNQLCARCHTPSALSGRQGLITNNMATVNLAMTGITLSDTQVADLQAFIATQ